MHRTAAALAATLALAACGEKNPPAPGTTPPAAPSAAPSAGAATTDHGATTDLGRLTIAGHELAVTRLGDVAAGREAAFEVALAKGPAGATLSTVAVYAWLEDEAGTQLCPPAKGSVEKDRLHFHVTPRADAKNLKRIVLRLRSGAADERGSLPLDGHGHEHGATPHEGVVASFKGPDGAVAGHVELKLHDDKGDLELWIAKDDRITQPFDLPLDAVVTVEFVDVGGRSVTLRVRNTGKNEDEDGTGNVRDGRTNYFIFPGETGADASWLVGPKFASIVRLTFSAGGTAYTSEEFMLVPHTHADGTSHK